MLSQYSTKDTETILAIKQGLSVSFQVKPSIQMIASIMNILVKLCIIPLLYIAHRAFLGDQYILIISTFVILSLFLYLLTITAILKKIDLFGETWSIYIEDMLIEIASYKKGQGNMEQIFIYTLRIQKFLRLLISLYRYRSMILIPGSDRALQETLHKVFSFIIGILMKLKGELQLGIQDQLNRLSRAKFEVEKNIQGTTELEQVSELQKARLDRQIEQFEELQKILVKA